MLIRALQSNCLYMGSFRVSIQLLPVTNCRYKRVENLKHEFTYECVKTANSHFRFLTQVARDDYVTPLNLLPVVLSQSRVNLCA